MNVKKIIIILIMPLILFLIISIYLQSRYIQLSYRHHALLKEEKDARTQLEHAQHALEKIKNNSNTSDDFIPLNLKQIYSISDESSLG